MKFGFNIFPYIVIGYLLLCIVVSVAIQQCVPSEIFRNNVEGFDSKNYMDDLSGQLCKIEDLVFCNNLSEKEAFDKVYSLIDEIPDSDKYTYKKDLQIIVEKGKDPTTTNYKSIFTSVMNKIKDDRIQIINDRIQESKSKVNDMSKSDEMVKASKE